MYQKKVTVRYIQESGRLSSVSCFCLRIAANWSIYSSDHWCNIILYLNSTSQPHHLQLHSTSQT